MSYTGFWTHRGSNDLIFVIKKGGDYVIAHFGEFVRNELGPGLIVVIDDYNNVSLPITPDWSYLISMEVQTKKWKSGNTAHLHVKFYFTKQWAQSVLKQAFSESQYKKNLEGIAKYWDEGKISHFNVVLGTQHPENVVVTTTPILDCLRNLEEFALPANKNVYFIAGEYRHLIEQQTQV
jgi:hypothetical protein